MNYGDEKILKPLLERFVLGTMSRRARRRFSRLVDEDSQIAASVYELEERLSPLAWSLTPVRPSELVWQRIARRAGLGKESSAQPSQSKRRPVLASALLLALIVGSVGWWQAIIRPSEVVVETITEPVPLEPSIGVIQDADGSALWVALIYEDLSRVDIRVHTAPETKDDNDYQLWLLRDDGTPVSVGLLPQVGERSLVLDAAAIEALRRSETLAVSLEPLGGSPELVPTGPVLFTAALLAP